MGTAGILDDKKLVVISISITAGVVILRPSIGQVHITQRRLGSGRAGSGGFFSPVVVS